MLGLLREKILENKEAVTTPYFPKTHHSVCFPLIPQQRFPKDYSYNDSLKNDKLFVLFLGLAVIYSYSLTRISLFPPKVYYTQKRTEWIGMLQRNQKTLF